MIRTVPIDEEQAEKIERLGVDLMREGEYEDATMLLAIALCWKVSPVARFKDEGMAEVVEMHGYSKKVPCR